MRADELFSAITDRLVAQIDAGVSPWSKPWTAASAQPRNYAGRNYRGANVFWLALEAELRGYAEPVWLTFKQAQGLGGTVRKGEKGTAVFFWSFIERADESGKLRRIGFAKTYTVFNVAQCDGLPAREAIARPTEIVRHADAEALLAATGAIIRHGRDRAFYQPSTDVVVLPQAASFKDADAYYATAFHEVAHWTGAKARLDRTFGKRFGDEAYAFEELVAELTAAYVCGALGLDNLARDDHASYLASWGRILRNDPKAFITAAGKAQAAADFILKSQASAEEDLEEAA
jgi:antirestriction protein ArdC